MPFRKHPFEDIMIKMYQTGMSGKEVANALGFKHSNSVRQVLKKRGLLRSQSNASSLAVKNGKKEISINKLIISSKTDNRNNPEKHRWSGKPYLHPMWKQDRTTLKYKRNSQELRAWRKIVFERDNYTCQECGQKGGKLNADHILPYIYFPELREDVDNGRTLCESCHKKTPTYGKKVITYFKNYKNAV